MSPTNAIPPVSPYGMFTGNLFQYKTFPSLVAFESSPPNQTNPSPHKCILIGGLSDGLIPTPYTKQLETACHELGWSLVQPMISSSGLGFGNGSLKRDTEELSDLMAYLVHHSFAETFAFVGHSTGCQNSVHFMKYAGKDMMEKVKVIALQAPVSDREGAMAEPHYETNIAHAKKLQAMGQEEEMMPRNAFWAPITAARFLALKDVGGGKCSFVLFLLYKIHAPVLYHSVQIHTMLYLFLSIPCSVINTQHNTHVLTFEKSYQCSSFQRMISFRLTLLMRNWV